MSKIGFNVEGFVSQELDILQDDLTVEELVEGLKEGKYLTTVDYTTRVDNTESVVMFDESGNEVKVASIVSQEVEGDICNFIDLSVEG